MARKIKSLSIDGVHVDDSKARFSNTFEVAQSDERLLAYDEEVLYVVVARVDAIRTASNLKTGEVIRTNILKIKEAHLVTDEDTKAELLDSAKFDYRPQPSLFDDEGDDEDDEVFTAAPTVRFPEPDEAELDFHGVGMAQSVPDSFEDEPLLADPPFEDVGSLEEFEAEFEAEPDEEEDAEFQKQMAHLKAVADEFDEADLYEPPNEPVLVETSTNGRKRYRPPQTSDEDPMLAKFMGE